jgi:signal transduction histidine kinase
LRARITLAFVLLIALAVAGAGGGASILVRHSQGVAAQRNIARAAQILVNAVKAKEGGDIAKPDVFAVIKQIASLDSETVVTVNEHGGLVSAPPPGIPAAEIERQGKVLAAFNRISGTYAGIAYAAVPLFVDSTGKGHSSTIALVFEASENFSSVAYFLYAGLIALVAVALLAALISRQISTRVVRVARASEQIANGDFEVRLTGSRRDYPEIAQLDRAINSMAADLSRAQQQEREFLLSISHDLRTPLTSIRGYSEAIADGAVPDPARAAKIVNSEAARLERLIGDLLDLARLRSHQFTFDPAVVDLFEVVSGSAEALRVAFASVGVALSVHRPSEPVHAMADPHRVAQIVADLLENALKYAATVVEITISGSGSEASIAVTDDGPGIDPDDLAHVLERLYTSDRHPARASGTGLGLAIVAELTTAMGGAVGVDSPIHDGTGTRVTVGLPLVGGAE